MKVINDKEIRKALDNTKHWSHLSVGEFLWVIGLHEGEGSFTLSYSRGHLQYARIKISMSDLDAIQKAKEIWQTDKIGIDDSKKKYKEMFYTQVNVSTKKNNGKHIELLEIMKPYFSNRRQEQLERMIIHALCHIFKRKFRVEKKKRKNEAAS